jgi:hypothetical protein
VVAWLAHAVPGVEARVYYFLACTLGGVLGIIALVLVGWGRQVTPWGATAVRTFLFAQLPLLLVILWRVHALGAAATP